MTNIIIPRKSEALTDEFFARHAAEVARDLLGRTLVRERPNRTTLYATIKEVAAYEGDGEDSMNVGALFAPGTLSISTKHGYNLIDIATYRMCEPDCVTLVGAIVQDGKNPAKVVQGSGKLAEALEIDKEQFHGLPLRISPLWFAGESASPDQVLERTRTYAPRNWKGTFYFR